MPDLPPSPRHHRLSLTWRVIALSSLLLLGLVALFSWLGHTNLNRQFEESREEQHARQLREIRLALRRSEDSLQQLAALTAASSRLGTALEHGERDGIVEALSSLWPTLQLDAGIDEVLVFSPLGAPLATWGESQAGSDRLFQAWVSRVMDSERPLMALRCASNCRQYAAVPALVEGESVGTVILSRTLADVTRQVQQVSDSDVALLVIGRHVSPSQPASRYLPDWQGRLVALTHQEQNLPLLREAARRTSVDELRRQPQRFRQGGRSIELAAVRLEEDDSRQNTSYFLLTSDITDQTRAIRQDTHTLMAVGVGGWLAAELLLLAIMLTPMARLRRIAALLPELAQGGFEQARAAIPTPRRRLPDEIDVLEGTTLALADQLEALEEKVSASGDQLAKRVEELARERDFVGSLLDTARMFIVSQDADGRIGLVNDYALSIMGTEEKRLLGRLFDDVFTTGTASPHLAAEAAQQEERLLVTPDGRHRTVIWYHAPLPKGQSEQAARISVGLDITERKAAEARLTWLAERDPLTELYNRRYFQEALGKALERGSQGGLLLLDLDQFKDVNELSGHHAGDRLLRQVANTLFEALGHRGIIARLGGDEFALLLEGADADQAIRVARQVTHLIEGIGLDAGGRRHRANASTGIALFPAHGNTPTDLMASADMAMYKAKEGGLQRWHLLSTVEHARDELQERVYWVERVRQALDEDAFELMVQPIMHLENQEIRHYEVLLRMRDNDGSLISPGQFIPVAERSGQIIQLDRWVLRHSLQALATLQQRGLSLAVNLSGHSLHDDDLRQFIADELLASGADPNYLILEVTETAAVTDFSAARGVLQAMRDLGCRTALDDFGAGFSSFHYLGQLPVDFIKIDGSFIRSLTLSPGNRLIVKAIADIAKGFGKQTIAEFVDQEALLPLLDEYGITYGQGFYLGRPQNLASMLS